MSRARRVVKSRLFRCLYPCNLMYLVPLAVSHILVRAGYRCRADQPMHLSTTSTPHKTKRSICITAHATISRTGVPLISSFLSLDLYPPLSLSHSLAHPTRGPRTRGERVCRTRQAHPAQHRPANKAIFNLPPTKARHLENPQFDLPGRPGIYPPYLSDMLLRGSSLPLRHH